MSHLVNHIENRELRSDSTLHVVATVTNPVRYHSRYRLARRFIQEMVNTPNVKLHMIEGTFGDRHHELKRLCEELGVDYFSVKLHSEIWVKENLLNIMLRRVIVTEPSAKYLGWFDTDIHFLDCHGHPSTEWAIETIHQLQHYQVVQPWSDAVDMTFDGGVHKHFKSFGYFSAKHIPQAPSVHNPYHRPYGHTGFAWACTRGFYENLSGSVGGLIPWALLGAGDAHMAWGMVGGVQGTINQQMPDGYKHLANVWQEAAVHACGSLVGYTPGLITHSHHGPKSARKYGSRWKILVKYKYDPMKDIRFDAQGVIKLKGKKRLEQAIMRYNRERQEDSIESY